MSDAAEKDRRHARKVSDLMGVGWLLTIAALLTYLALMLSETCDAAGVCQNRFQTFLNSPANEIGDTLAGFAGGLAFLWLTITVLLQRLELQAQREEMARARTIMDAQLEEMAATAAHQQKTAEALEVQAAIFRDEQRDRIAARAERVLNERLIDYRAVLVRSIISVKWGLVTEAAIGPIPEVEPIVFNRADEAADIEDTITLSGQVSRHFAEALEAGVFDRPWIGESSTDGRQIFRDLIDIAAPIHALAPDLAEDQEVRVRRAGIVALVSAVEALLEKDIWRPLDEVERDFKASLAKGD